MSIRKIVKLLSPPILVKGLRRALKLDIFFYGDFNAWQQAKKKSTGYDEGAILTQVYQSTSKVVKGEAVFERDSVCFHRKEFRWPILANLLDAALNCDQLHVLDFGGSLGSLYHQHRVYLDKIKNFSWNIVEQKHFVESGKKNFETSKLRFWYSIDDCLNKSKCDIAILSSVLQYIDNPEDVIRQLSKHNIKKILIDRSPFINGTKNIIKIQYVPKFIYSARYPVWFFSYNSFLHLMESEGYSLISEFSCKETDAFSEYKGLLFEKKNQSAQPAISN